MLTLKKIEKDIEGNKRQYFPYVLTDICSTCGETLEMDLSEGHYLSEPIFGFIYKTLPTISYVGITIALFCIEAVLKHILHWLGKQQTQKRTNWVNNLQTK